MSDNLNTIISIFITGIPIGALIGIGFKHLLDNKKSASALKKENFRKIFDEYCSESFLKHRRKADKYLKEIEDGHPFSDLLDCSNEENAFSISMVLHYFQKVELGCDSGLLDKTLCKRYLRDQFNYWYDEYLKQYKVEIEMRSGFKEVIKLAKRWDLDK